jgi:hypothetical protein
MGSDLFVAIWTFAKAPNYTTGGSSVADYLFGIVLGKSKHELKSSKNSIGVNAGIKKHFHKTM